jgi:hypothetical protein
MQRVDFMRGALDCCERFRCAHRGVEIGRGFALVRGSILSDLSRGKEVRFRRPMTAITSHCPGHTGTADIAGNGKRRASNTKRRVVSCRHQPAPRLCY